MTAKTCPSEYELRRFDLGDLVADRYEEVSHHLDSCTECVRKFETLHAQADGLIDLLRQPLPLEVIEEDSEVRRLMDSVIDQESVSQARNAESPVAGDVKERSFDELARRLLSPPQAADELGRLGGYRVLEVLGAGGMGVVFKAEDPALKRLVALKAMLPHVVATGESACERFLREARSTAALQHDNIVTIYQVGQAGAVPFLAMQLLSGKSLAKRLVREPRLPLAEVLLIARETALGLAAAHAKGLTHRDIKPDNLWLERLSSEDSSYRVKILDFGLARAADDQQHLTNSDAVVGTPSYLAPEQARGLPLDSRADLFSLGVVIYQLLTGIRPFARDTLTGTLLAITTDAPRPLFEFRDDLPPALVELVMRLLAKKPDDRPGSANEVVRAIRELESPSSEPVNGPSKVQPPTRPRTLIAAGAIALSLLAATIVIIRNKDGKEIARIEAPDGVTVEIKSSERVPPEPQPEAPTLRPPIPVNEYLPRMSPSALVERPAKLVPNDGSEPVESWTIATAAAPANIDSPHRSALRPDGTKLATFGDDGNIRILDLEHKQPVQLLVGHAGGPALAYLPNGKWERTNSRRFGPLAWHPHKAWLASVSRDGSLRIWDTDTGRVVFQQSTAPGDLNMAAWSPDGAQLAAACSLSRAVRIWNTGDWQAQKSLDGLESSPANLLWSPDSLMLAVGAKSVLLYNPRTEEIQVLPGAQVADGLSGSPSVRWSTDGKYVAYRTRASVLIVDGRSFERIREIRRPGAADAKAVDFAWSPDGSRVLIAWKEGIKSVQTIHNLTSEEIARTLEVPAGGASREYLEWLPDGRTAVINRQVLDLETQAILQFFAGRDPVRIDRLHDWSDDGRRVVLYKFSDSRPYVFGFDTPNRPEELYAAGGIGSLIIHGAAWSPDRLHLNLSGNRGVFSFNNEGEFTRFFRPARNIMSWSPSGTQTLSGGDGSNSISICRWPSGEVTCEIKLPFDSDARATSWSPDGSKVVVIAQANRHQVAIFNATSGEILKEWTAPSLGGVYINSLDWHGERIAIAVSNGYWSESAVHIWSSTDTDSIVNISPTRTGHRVRFLPDGSQILRFSRSDKTALHDATDGSLVREFPLAVDAVHFIDQATALLAVADGTIQRLNLTTGDGEIVSRFAGAAQLFSPDGQFLIADLAGIRRIVSVADGQTMFSIADSTLLVSPEGHMIANPLPKGSVWATTTGVRDSVVYVVQTAGGQQTLTPVEFFNRYGWQNDPDKLRLLPLRSPLEK